MYLMPQLPTPFAEILARQLCGLSVAECRQHRSLEHTNRIFSPTGGTRVGDLEYARLRDELSAVAEKAGYPQDSATARTRFDIEVAIFLHREFKVTENEAAKQGVWNFLSCVALPDLVRWRFLSSDETPADRFLAGQKNTFERLWWRSKAYYDASETDAYWLVRQIGEDESVGMMERTTLSGIRPFVLAALRALIECYKTKPPIARSELMRDAMKRLRRLGGVVALEALQESELGQLCNSVFNESIGSPKSTAGSPAKNKDKPMPVQPAPAKSQPTKSSSGASLSSEDLAWLEADIKRNQGIGRKR
jgi:hypothetical protein